MSFDSTAAYLRSTSPEARPQAIVPMGKAPVAVALARTGRGGFSTWDEGDDWPALAMIVPLGVLLIWTIWEMVGSF